MKAKITKISAKDVKDGKFGKEYSYLIEYDGKEAYYTSYKKENTHFVSGKECEFVEEERTSKGGNKYTIVKAPKSSYQSGYGKNHQKEQAKYSGFAVSYVKDLIIAGEVEMKHWESASEKIFKHMVALDKSIES